MVPVPRNINNILNNENQFVNPLTPNFIRNYIPSPVNPINQIVVSPPQKIIPPLSSPKVANVLIPANSPLNIQNQQIGSIPINNQLSIQDNPIISFPSQPLMLKMNNKAENASNIEQVTGQLKNAGPQRISTSTYQTPAGMATKTIIEEPFYIEQPPKISKVYSVVNKPITIQPPPETQIVEEVINVPYIVQPPPQKQIIMSILNKPIEISQLPEKQIIRQKFQTPVLVQPAPEKFIINQKVQKKVLINQPPKTVIKRTEYSEPPIMLDDGIETQISNLGSPSKFNQVPIKSGQVLYTGSFVEPSNEIMSPVRSERIISTIPREISQVNMIPINNLTPNYVSPISENIPTQEIANVEEYPPVVISNFNSSIPILSPTRFAAQPMIVEPTNMNQITNIIPHQNLTLLNNDPPKYIISNPIEQGIQISPVQQMNQPTFIDQNPFIQTINYQSYPILNTQNIEYDLTPQMQYQSDPNITFSQRENSFPLGYSVNFYN